MNNLNFNEFDYTLHTLHTTHDNVGRYYESINKFPEPEKKRKKENQIIYNLRRFFCERIKIRIWGLILRYKMKRKRGEEEEWEKGEEEREGGNLMRIKE